MSGQLILMDDPMRPAHELVHTARMILSEAIEEHNPIAIYIALSGGNDSRAVTHVALPLLANDPRFKGAVLVDTGIAVAEAHESVREFARSTGIELTVAPAREREYERFVLAHGFPGPAQHHRMYQRLKERAIEQVLAQSEVGHSRRSRVLFVSGIRKYESRRRVKLTQPITRRGGAVWCNPLFWWTTPERNAYIAENGITTNPISPYLCGSSGDCLCGAMAHPHGDEELETLRQFFRPAYNRICGIQAQARAAGVWDKWGTKPPGEPARLADDETIFMPMCVSCEAKAATCDVQEGE